MPEICRSFGVLIEPADKITLGVLLRTETDQFFIFNEKMTPVAFYRQK